MTELALVFSALAVASGIGLMAEAPRSALLGKIAKRERLSPRIPRFAKSNELTLLMEIPEFCSVLWFLISAGHNLEQALRITLSKTSGQVSAEFRAVIQNVDFGGLVQLELENLSQKTKHPCIRELATKLSMASLNGSLLADQLAEFMHSVSKQLRSELLDKAAKSETKMMIPLVFIILPITVIFALYPSVVIIQQSF